MDQKNGRRKKKKKTPTPDIQAMASIRAAAKKREVTFVQDRI
jgi:hypothetical protein